MNFYLLDAGAPGLIVGVMIVFMLVIIVLEAVTMLIMKYNKAGKAFLDSLVINIISMVAGYSISFFRSLDLLENPFFNVVALFVITFLVEFVILYLLNRTKPVQKTLLAAIAINVVSYIIFYLVRYIF